MPALAELEAGVGRRARRRRLPRRARRLLRDFVGRPSPLYLAHRLSEVAGRRLYLKREDLNHTGAHKINNAIGQALLARRMGKRRIIAETGAGQHGVATATACALMDLECVVYMGVEDIRRQAPNVQRMELLGATVSPVDAGARTLKEAASEAIRDWVDQRRHDALHHRLGRRPGALPGDRARPAARDRRRGARPDPRARGAPARPRHRLRRRRLQRDRHLRALRRRRGRRAHRRRGRRRGARARPPRRAAHRRRAPRRAARIAVGRAAGRDGPDPRGALDLGRPGLSGQRPRARPPARHRARALPRGQRRRGPGDLPARHAPGGDHPRAGDRARAALRAGSPPTPSSTSCAARGAATRTWPRSSGRHDDAG